MEKIMMIHFYHHYSLVALLFIFRKKGTVLRNVCGSRVLAFENYRKVSAVMCRISTSAYMVLPVHIVTHSSLCCNVDRCPSLFHTARDIDILSDITHTLNPVYCSHKTGHSFWG